MMYFVLFCALFFAVSDAKQTYVDLPQKFTRLLTEKSPGCVEESGADKEILQRVFLWQFDNDESSKKFSFCLFKNIGLNDDTGHFYVDEVLALFENSDQKDEIAKVSMECNKIVAENPFETMYKELQCFIAESPVLLRVKIE